MSCLVLSSSIRGDKIDFPIYWMNEIKIKVYIFETIFNALFFPLTKVAKINRWTFGFNSVFIIYYLSSVLGVFGVRVV